MTNLSIILMNIYHIHTILVIFSEIAYGHNTITFCSFWAYSWYSTWFCSFSKEELQTLMNLWNSWISVCLGMGAAYYIWVICPEYINPFHSRAAFVSILQGLTSWLLCQPLTTVIPIAAQKPMVLWAFFSYLISQSLSLSFSLSLSLSLYIYIYIYIFKKIYIYLYLYK